MPYFEKLDIIEYEGREVRNISMRTALRKLLKDKKEVFFWYELQDGETPEQIAFDFYGKSELHWIILLMNDIIDPFYDWLLASKQLKQLAILKYGEPSITNGQYESDGYNTVRHWRDTDGSIHIVNDGANPPEVAPLGSIPVTYLEHMDNLNEEKRRIKVLHPEFVSQMKRELEFLLDEQR